MSLLDKALKIKVQRKNAVEFTKDDFELILAWVNDEVTLTQVAQVKSMSGTGNAYAYLAAGLKIMMREK